MLTLVFLVIVGFGLYRIVKVVAANPGASMKAASWFKDAFGK